MRSKGSPLELAHRRTLAVQRVLDGYSIRQVARFLGVARFSVQRWIRLYRGGGLRRLAPHRVPGRISRIDGHQRRIILSWLMRPATEFGFVTDRWTAPRVTQLIAERFGIRFHREYVSRWLKRQGVTPQVPARTPQERNEKVIAEWVAVDWPRIKKKSGN
jgi:transposase